MTEYEMMDKILKAVSYTYTAQANKTFKQTTISEFYARVYVRSERDLKIKTLFTKSTDRTIEYTFMVTDGVRSLASGLVVFKRVKT